jgi:hypothetical protein
VGCSDGTIQYHVRSTHITTPIKRSPSRQRSANGKITGWTIGPRARASSPRPTLRHLVVGPLPELRHHLRRTRQRDELPSPPLAQSHSDVTTFNFNGTPVGIVVTPYVTPAV